MNRYRSVKLNSGIRPLSIALILLLLLEACSVIMLGSRLVGFSPAAKQRQYIPLNEESGDTHLTVTKKPEPAKISASQTSFLSGGSAGGSGTFPSAATGFRPASYEHGFHVDDEEGLIWATDTGIELFKFSYENGENVCTVKGDGSKRLIAPGTSNTYTFTLLNTGTCTLDYEMTVDAYVTGTDQMIPINARLMDYTGEYLAGTADDMVPILDVGGIHRSGAISGGYIADYIIEWEWPFERGGEAEDEYDTFLGDSTLENEVSVMIVITTVAECNIDHEGGEPAPQTGDDTKMLFWLIVMVLTFVMLIILLSSDRRREEDEEEETAITAETGTPGGP